jgi:CelD/BcsL family acetyltransferase involved in cellulose biosynthesis
MISDQRRQWKRAKEVLPGISFKIIKEDTEVEAAIDWILSHKLRWLSTKNKSAVYFNTDEMQELIKNISKSKHNQGNYVLAKLSDGETIISAGFGYKFGSDFLFHMFTYDEAWNRLSPSRLFLEELVRWCFDHGVKTFDFMPGDEQYKTIWATDLVHTHSYTGSLTLRGGFILWWSRLVDKNLQHPKILQKIYSYIPNYLRQSIRIKLTQMNLLGLGFKSRPKTPILFIKAVNNTDPT